MENSRHWRLRKQRLSLVGEVCPHCTVKIFPPKDICLDCGHSAGPEYKFSGKGNVYSLTKATEPPAGFENQTPYMVAIIKLKEGPLVTAQITDMGEANIEIGTEVEMVTRKLRQDGETGMIVYGYKFRPTISS